MKRFLIVFSVLAFALAAVGSSSALPIQDSNYNTATAAQPRTMITPPSRRHRRRHSRGDRARSIGVKSSYNRAGKSMGRGSKGLASNVRHGRLARGGKEFGQGAGSFGKDVGYGTAQAAKKGAGVTVDTSKKVADVTVDDSKKVGHATANGAKKVGNATVHGTKKAGSAVKKAVTP